MDDFSPYIIVDNQKIAPLVRSRFVHRTNANMDTHGEGDPPFGVVDRVTISNAARQRYQWYLERVERENVTSRYGALPVPDSENLAAP